MPNYESFKNSKQFLVIYIIVQLHHGKSVGVKSNWMNFIIFVNNGKNCSKSIVQSISFHDKLSIRNLMSENRRRDKCFLKTVESLMIGGVELLENILLGKACQ